MRTPADFANALQINAQAGFLLACRETLIQAIKDPRLERTHLRCLAGLVSRMDKRSGYTFVGRSQLAQDMAGSGQVVSEKTVSNTLAELRALGYILSDRRTVAEANNRSLLVTTIAPLNLEQLQSEITRYCEAASNARPQIGPKVPRVRGTQTSPPAVNFPADGELRDPSEHCSSPSAGLAVPRLRGAVSGKRNSREEETNVSYAFGELDLSCEPLSVSAVKRMKSYVSVELPTEDRSIPISLQWLQGQRRGVDNELLLEFAEVEARRFVDESPKTRNGRPMTLFGFMGLAFQYRFDQWLASRTGTAVPRRNDDPMKPVKTASGNWTRQGLLMRPEDIPDLSNIKPLQRID